MFWKASSTLLASRADVSINERLFSPNSRSASQDSGKGVSKRPPRTCKLLGLFRGHSPQVPQITLVTDQHDHDVGVGMVAKFLQPTVDIVVGLVLADIVHEESTDGTTVVSGGDGTVAFLTSSIPNLRLDCLGVDLDRAGSELDTDGGLRVQVELVTGETTQKVGLSNTRVSNQDNCSEQTVVG